MSLLENFLIDELPEMLQNGIRLVAIGERELLPSRVRKRLEEAEERTAHNEDMTLVLAVSYDGRRDLVEAVRRLTDLASRGQLLPADVSEQQVMAALSTHRLPDVDLLIRTSGEQRLSGFCRSKPVMPSCTSSTGSGPSSTKPTSTPPSKTTPAASAASA
jgi:undecaprenyl diphosphate synthase